MILSKKPKQYPIQGKSHCGAYTTKAILSAYKRKTENNVKSYHISFLGKTTGGIFPRTFIKLLGKNGVNAIAKKANNLTDEDRIFLLKNLLNKNRPVILLIGNGYGKNGKHSSLKAKLVGHWISLWGYDENKNRFYVYDSAARNIDNQIPIGNISRSYQEIIRDWNGPIFPYPSSFFYIEIVSI